MRTVYLIDTENVANTALKYADLVESRDKLILFIGMANVTIPLEDAIKLNQCKASSIETIQCICNGNNALDFQLSSYLGNLIRGAPKTNYVIISNDHGYKPLVTFWKQRGTNVYVYPNIKEAVEGLNGEPANNDEIIDSLSADEIGRYNLALQRNKSLLGNIIRDRDIRNKVAELIYEMQFSELHKLSEYGVKDTELKRIKGIWNNFTNRAENK